MRHMPFSPRPQGPKTQGCQSPNEATWRILECNAETLFADHSNACAKVPSIWSTDQIGRLLYSMACIAPMPPRPPTTSPTAHCRPGQIDPRYALPRNDSIIWGREHDQFVHQLITLWQPLRADCTRGKFVVVDVGVNTGAITLNAAAHGARVYGFEALESNAAVVARRVAQNGFLRLVHLTVAAAAATDEGTVTFNDNFYVHANGDWQRNGQAVRDGQQPPAGEVARSVPLRRVDRVVPSDTEVLLFKVDVEGMEYEAVGGAKALFSPRPRVAVVHTELSPANMRAGSARDYLQRFFTWGYRAFLEDCSHNIEDQVREAIWQQLGLVCANQDGGVQRLLGACKAHDSGQQPDDSAARYEVKPDLAAPLVRLLGRSMISGLVLCRSSARA